MPFNPFDYSSLFLTPKRVHLGSSWTEHVPFGMMLIELHRPRVVVELGTHWGISYCAFCQVVANLKLEASCFAVDTWSGDDHAGFYRENVYENLKKHHAQYESFSKLVRKTFDEARDDFSAQSVDFLHIDGLHTYEAVKHDFESWLPKMSERGIVLFHDTSVLSRNFGVHKFWAEISSHYPSFKFWHGHGLGILLVGADQTPEVRSFFEMGIAQSDAVCKLFAALGKQTQLEAEQRVSAASSPLRRRYLALRACYRPMRRVLTG